MNIKILKLRSGEEIACQVLEQNETIVKIFQPMLFKTTSSYDIKGRLIDVTTLSDWLVNTDVKHIELPMNHVAFVTEPSKDTLSLYTLESAKEFSKDNTSSNLKKIDVEENLNSQDILLDSADIISNLLGDLFNSSDDIMGDMLSPPPKRRNNKRKKKSKKYALPPDMTDEKELDRHMIMMQMYIPAESIMNLITAGILKPQVLLDMIDEVKKRNRFTGDEKDKKDFGNNMSDWNPDPNSNDYQ